MQAASASLLQAGGMHAHGVTLPTHKRWLQARSLACVRTLASMHASGRAGVHARMHATRWWAKRAAPTNGSVQIGPHATLMPPCMGKQEAFPGLFGGRGQLCQRP